MISAEEASEIQPENSILDILNEKVQDRAAKGFSSACIYQIRQQYSDACIEEAVEELNDLGYNVDVASEAGVGPEMLVVFW